MRHSLSTLCCALLITLFVSACETKRATTSSINTTNQPNIASGNMTVCKEPRSPMCTREYRPVCASVNGEHKTYSTGCTACADPKVKGYWPKPCP